MPIDKTKPVLFCGIERPWQEVFEYYEMIRDAYNDYVNRRCEVMTDAKRLYVTSFKFRVDSVAELLGIGSKVSLPSNIDKIKNKANKETNEENDGQ